MFGKARFPQRTGTSTQRTLQAPPASGNPALWGNLVEMRFKDDPVGRVLNALADAGVLDETIVIISPDHGENLLAGCS